MINNSKILTVSYGTFSCTLEGFEDSFGTMKAIAEYFRDLAADDRYFGAEPPQPDAEMLARIAQKEVSRKVAAREQDGQIVLSALDDGLNDTAAAPPASAQEMAPAQTDTATLALAAAPAVAGAAAVAGSALRKADADTPAAQPDVQIDIEDAAAADLEPAAQEIDTTALLNSIDLSDGATEDAPGDPDEVDNAIAEEPVAASEDIAEEEAEEPVAAPEDIAEEEATLGDVQDEVEDFEDAIAEDAAQTADIAEADLAEAEVDEPDIVPGQPDAEVEAFFAAEVDEAEAELEEDAVQAVAAAPAPEAPAVDGPAPDSIAAKLQRIRAVVSQQTEAEPETDYTEDEHADPSAADPIAQARADIEDALEADQATYEDAVEDTDAPAEAAKVEEEDELSALLSRVRASEEDANATEAPQEDDVDEAQGADTVNNLFEEDADLDVAEDVIAAEREAPRARVIKVKRADMEAALEKGALEEVAEDEASEATQSTPTALDALAPAKRATTSLSPEEEAELAEELTALTEDFNAEEEHTADEDAPQSADQPEAAPRGQLPSLDEGDNTDVNRLLAETDHHMDEPEGATRRDAFAHLRAAVAARKADATIESDEEAAKGNEAYRDDLAQVVRPRRPTAGAGRTERPEGARPAPLKLVAEQRVDVDAPKSDAPVRPRRVATIEADEQDGESFAEFAEEMGANTLAEKLEAAAAYLSFVEGREQFSRPQLMSKARQAVGEEAFSREEGLRSFGMLLRKGKIAKIKGGRFTVSEEIGFRPDERAAG